MSSSRICCACKLELPIEDFHFKVKALGTRQSRCNTCERAYSRSHYEANHQQYIDRNRRVKRALRLKKREIVAAIKSQPCLDCGNTFPPCCMQFDHRNGRAITGSDSPETIANMKNSLGTVDRLCLELEKCDLVCANCHCLRTYTRRQAGWTEEVSS